jgi:hypothetical protein
VFVLQSKVFAPCSMVGLQHPAPRLRWDGTAAKARKPSRRV